MRLLDRIGLLIKADAHGVFESIEDRRLLAKQCIREAKFALDSKRAHIASLRNDQQRLTREAARLGAVMGRVDQDVDLALGRGQAQLARAAIRKLLPLRDAGRQLAVRIEQLQHEEERLQQRLAVQEQEFEILKTRLEADLTAAEVTGDAAGGFERPAVTEEDVELELLRRSRGAPGDDVACSSEEVR